MPSTSTLVRIVESIIFELSLIVPGIAEFGDQFFKDELDSDGKLKEPDRRCLTIDLDAACDTVKLAVYYMRKNKEGGSIVMTASLAGYLASAGAPHYSAAKHGQLSHLYPSKFN